VLACLVVATRLQTSIPEVYIPQWGCHSSKGCPDTTPLTGVMHQINIQTCRFNIQDCNFNIRGCNFNIRGCKFNIRGCKFNIRTCKCTPRRCWSWSGGVPVSGCWTSRLPLPPLLRLPRLLVLPMPLLLLLVPLLQQQLLLPLTKLLCANSCQIRRGHCCRYCNYIGCYCYCHCCQLPSFRL
jgi:hypothetical protein